jgi:hypothetical protein
LEFANQFAQHVDAALQKINCEYQEKRGTGRLAELTAQVLPDGTWAKFTRRRQQGLGGSLEQYKHPCLAPDLKFTEEILLLGSSDDA